MKTEDHYGPHLLDWDVFEIERPNVVVARARIEPILNGCVVHEVYEGLDGHKWTMCQMTNCVRYVASGAPMSKALTR